MSTGEKRSAWTSHWIEDREIGSIGGLIIVIQEPYIANDVFLSPGAADHDDSTMLFLRLGFWRTKPTRSRSLFTES